MVIAFTVLLVTSSQLGAEQRERILSVREILKREGSAVVMIEVHSRDGRLKGQASGVVLRPEGIVATNAHVLNGACDLRLKVDAIPATPSPSTVVSLEFDADIAILRFDAVNLRTATIGNSKALEIGDRVIAIGNPMGLQHTVSEGIVSGLRPVGPITLIQTTAPISPGSSGGGLYNQSGRLVGLTTFTLGESQNLNFAIPIETVLAYLDSPKRVAETPWTTVSKETCSEDNYSAHLDSAEILGTIGARLLDSRMQAFLRRLGGGRLPNPRRLSDPSVGDVAIFDFYDIGISVQVTDGVVSSVVFLGPSDPSCNECEPFPGVLPLSLRWGIRRSEILTRWGSPNQSPKLPNGFTWPRAWDIYYFGGLAYWLNYDPELQLARVSVHPRH